jgi:hypothetical protein
MSNFQLSTYNQATSEVPYQQFSLGVSSINAHLLIACCQLPIEKDLVSKFA